MEKGLKKGLKQGLKQGLEKGLKQGLEKGIKAGKEEGKMEEKFLIASNAKKQGLPPATISALTGLSIEEIEKL